MKSILLLLSTSILWTTETSGQGIKEIEFAFHHSLRIPFNEVIIKAISHEDKAYIVVKANPLHNDQRWRKTKIDTTYSLAPAEFERLEAMVKTVQTEEFINSMIGMGDDGTLWKLTFGDLQNTISYQVWTPHYETKERGLRTFIDVCTYMMKLAKLNHKKILD